MHLAQGIANQSVTDVIRARHSVRSYGRQPVGDETREQIMTFASELRGPFGVPVRFRWVSAIPGEPGAVSPGAGGMKGAQGYLAAALPGEGRFLEELGYCMETAILYMSGLGLGTCWVGGSLDYGAFEKAVGAAGAETVPCVVSVGYPAEKQGVMSAFTRKAVGSEKRMPWGELFYRDRFGGLLAQKDAGDYARPLEMVRLAPSASNRQPWRVVSADGRYHFFLERTPGYLKKLRYDLQRVDMGIAMCHFEAAAIEAGLKGHWSMKKAVLENAPQGIEFIATWVSER